MPQHITQPPMGRTPEGDAELESWQNEGGAGDEEARRSDASADDLNSLLAQEQRAIMREEVATTVTSKDVHREEALRLRDLVDLTPYPAREPHDFGRPRHAEPDEFLRDLHALRKRVGDMEHLLAVQFSEGIVGIKHNSFQHRGRLVRQARDRLNEMVVGNERPQ